MASRARKRKRRGPAYQPPQRKSRGVPGQEGAAPGRPERPRRAPRGQRDRPPAPWGSFPLVELVVLAAMVILIAGFFVQGTKGVTMIAAGITLGMLAGLELSIREHFAGYRSHSTVLAGAVAVVVLGLGFFLMPEGWPQAINLVLGAAVFTTAFYLFREAFKRRSGGLGFR